ncbi:MAG: SUMF1/EgtB/PvdO family nonheme iron enzyme, partial [Anaerolineae bacterium]|nr:SUMF1/EgtB/PvdO family nonheme iron enzyme [Anaerolineae bacterium]
MKRYLPLFLLAILLLVLGLTARLWLPVFLDFVGANSELIQGLEALVQLVLLAGGALLAVLGYRRIRQPAPATTTTVDTGGGAYVGGSVSTNGGDWTGRDSIVTGGGNITSIRVERDLVIQTAGELAKRASPAAGDPDALRRATETYLTYLLDRHRYLQLKGMGVHDRIPLQLPLLDLYVPLRARLEMPAGETWQRHLRLAGRPLEPAEADAGDLALSSRLGEPIPVLDLLAKNEGLIVLGDPGAGKTTFLKVLALQLALGRGERLGIGERLPLLASLADYAGALSGDPDLRLDRFIAGAYKASGLDLPMDEMVGDALAHGRALLLLDGLDEVRQAGLRHRVVERVMDFCTGQQRRGNKFVLTSRIVGYRAVRPTRQDGLAECTLVDFDDQEIEAFVSRWTATLERQAQGDTAISAADARRERQDLLDTVQRNPAVRRLAANPLLLTMLAMMKRQGVALPERRVQLYHQAVETLISSWNRARGMGRQAPSRELDPVATIGVLAPLALWIHQESPGVGLVTEWALRQKLEEIYRGQGAADPPAAAGQFLRDIPAETGLLLARGEGQYGFIHLTFEEYLAAVGIAALGQVDLRPVTGFLSQHVGDPVWREASLLTVGYLGIVQRRPLAAGEVAAALATERPGPPGEAVVLAGEAVLDAWPDGVTAACKETVVAALVETMQAAAVPPPLRLRAGDALGRLGDPRRGVGLVQGVEPPLPDIDWVAIPAGPFTMGSAENDDMAYNFERPAHQVDLRLFYMARYPVTNAQFRPFVEGDGYDNPDYWTAEGWAWRNGAEADLSPIQDVRDEDWKRRYAEWLARRPKERRDRPWYWDDLDLSTP